jgi:hypothetical protein
MKPSGDFQGRIGKSIKTSIDAQQSLLRDSKTIAKIASICAPTGETARIQECHILIGHAICEIVEQELFG